MNREELDILLLPEVRDSIDANIEREQSSVALDKSLCHSSVVATQVKYLQRAHHKLPELYRVRGIIPPRAYEQSSSEASAAAKALSGNSLLELTCGLGVDAAALSRRFARVVTLERDEVLADVARENFSRLGITNIEVVTTSAEEYLAQCEEHFDWIMVDPDRRASDGSRRVVLEGCSPNIIELWWRIEQISERVAIKCSPLFDADEAFRLFGNCCVEAVSIGDECKELMIYSRAPQTELRATAIGKGSVTTPREGEPNYPTDFQADNYTHLLLPDVSLQKCRIARRILSEVCDIWSDNGFGFASAEQIAHYNPERHLSRLFTINWLGDSTKELRRELKSRGITRAEIIKRDYPHPISGVFNALKIKEGGECKIAVTKLQNRTILAILAQ